MNVRAAICAIHWPTVLTILEALTASATQDTPGMALLAVQVCVCVCVEVNTVTITNLA